MGALRESVNPGPEPLLIEARLLTMERRGEATRPRAGGAVAAVACAGGRIVAVGPAEACARALPAAHRRIVAPEATLLPGFIDAHVHVLAAAAAAAGPDVSPRVVTTLDELLGVTGDAARRAAPGQWVRAYGYEETMLAEGRPPTRAELDAVAPERPVRLIQRSGHAEVLNSPALALVGIDESTPEPPGAAFGRSLEDGRLDGLLAGMTELIERAMPPPDPAAVEAAVRAWAHARAAEGVTSLVDAGVRNGVAEWATVEQLLGAGAIPQRLVMMESVDALGRLPDRAAGGRLARGETKLQPAAFEGETVEPGPIARLLADALKAGRRVAVHAPTEAAVAATLAAFRAAGAPPGQRLEHAPLLTSELIEEIAALGAAVVAQPALLTEVAPRYERLLDAGQRARLQPWRSLLNAGVPLGFSSDAPVSRSSPLAASAAASTERPETLSRSEAITPLEALFAWTAGAADVAGLEDRGHLREGQAADLVLVAGAIERNPAAGAVRLTVVAGEVVFEPPAD